jgi:hypothetical protein
MLKVKEEWDIHTRRSDKLYREWQKRYLSGKEDTSLGSKLVSTDWNAMYNKRVDSYNRFVKKISKFNGYAPSLSKVW